MDYKKLIDRLNAYSAKHQRHGGITAEAADAIETLLRNETRRWRICVECVGVVLTGESGKRPRYGAEQLLANI